MFIKRTCYTETGYYPVLRHAQRIFEKKSGEQQGTKFKSGIII